MDTKSHQVECIIPVLPVADLERSIAFYTERLGFKVDWKSGEFCSVSRDGRPLMLSQRGQGAGGTWVWIGLESDALFDEFRQRGAAVMQEPRNYPWAYEMKFVDPDGNVLWLGTESRADLPLFEPPPAQT